MVWNFNKIVRVSFINKMTFVKRFEGIERINNVYYLCHSADDRREQGEEFSLPENQQETSMVGVN